jgi:hypothetical protein
MSSPLSLRPNPLTSSTDQAAAEIWRIITTYFADPFVNPDTAAAGEYWLLLNPRLGHDLRRWTNRSPIT